MYVSKNKKKRLYSWERLSAVCPLDRVWHSWTDWKSSISELNVQKLLTHWDIQGVSSKFSGSTSDVNCNIVTSCCSSKPLWSFFLILQTDDNFNIWLSVFWLSFQLGRTYLGLQCRCICQVTGHQVECKKQKKTAVRYWKAVSWTDLSLNFRDLVCMLKGY